MSVMSPVLLERRPLFILPGDYKPKLRGLERSISLFVRYVSSSRVLRTVYDIIAAVVYLQLRESSVM